MLWIKLLLLEFALLYSFFGSFFLLVINQCLELYPLTSFANTALLYTIAVFIMTRVLTDGTLESRNVVCISYTSKFKGSMVMKLCFSSHVVLGRGFCVLLGTKICVGGIYRKTLKFKN